MKYWSLREELYIAFHQWPHIVAFFIIGCILGYSISIILPPTYRTVSQVYVALNPYRTYSDTNFLALASPKYSNIDDYKNWQMSELESVIFLDEIIDETLTKLREQNESWQEVNTTQLYEMLDAEWRSAGTWNLVAEGNRQDLTREAVKTWSDVAIKRVLEAVQAAQKTISIDEKRISTENELNQSISRLETLETTELTLNLWIDRLKDYKQDQQLETIDRWQLSSIIASAADFSVNWSAQLAAMPDPQADPEEYLDWLSQILYSIEAEKLVINRRLHSLEQLSTDLEQQYSTAFKKSLGLSPNLFVEQYQILPTRKLQSTSTVTLIGGVIGLLLWVLLQLVRITRKTKRA